MAEPNIDLHSFNNGKREEANLIDESYFDEYVPIQKNSKLFKFLLYTTKVEIKFNSLVSLLYNTSLYEIGFWIFGFFVFCVKPRDLWLIWLLVIHLAKGGFGFLILNVMPKTQEIIENVANNPNCDEDKIIELIQAQIRESSIKKWADNKKKLFGYLIFTIVCVFVDIIIFIVQIAAFGKDEWILMQTCMLFIILVFIISDVIYFLWLFTLRFSLPQEIYDPVKKAILGSVADLKALIFSKFKKQNDSVIN